MRHRWPTLPNYYYNSFFHLSSVILNWFVFKRRFNIKEIIPTCTIKIWCKLELFLWCLIYILHMIGYSFDIVKGFLHIWKMYCKWKIAHDHLQRPDIEHIQLRYWPITATTTIKKNQFFLFFIFFLQVFYFWTKHHPGPIQAFLCLSSLHMIGYSFIQL